MQEKFITLLNDFKNSGIQEAVNFELMNEILISYHSTAIEGSSLTLEEALLLVTENITAKGKPLQDHDMVRDHQQALVETVRLARQKTEINSELIQKISALVMRTTGGPISAAAGNYDSSKGDFRKSMVHVGARYFSNYEKVPQEVEKLCTQINENLKNVHSPEDIYDLAFDAHFYLVTIHPFADGNGRVARLLMNYILAYHGQPLAVLFTEDKLEYYQALEATRQSEPPVIKIFRDFMYQQQAKYLTQEMAKAKI